MVCIQLEKPNYNDVDRQTLTTEVSESHSGPNVFYPHNHCVYIHPFTLCHCLSCTRGQWGQWGRGASPSCLLCWRDGCGLGLLQSSPRLKLRVSGGFQIDTNNSVIKSCCGHSHQGSGVERLDRKCYPAGATPPLGCANQRDLEPHHQV